MMRFVVVFVFGIALGSVMKYAVECCVIKRDRKKYYYSRHIHRLPLDGRRNKDGK